MAASLLIYTQIVLLFLVVTSLTRLSRADVPAVIDAAKEISLNLATDEFDWAMYDGVDIDIDEIGMENDDGDLDISTAATATAAARRSLFWRRMGYYISYGALSANRVPCPPRSGRSYYTHDCWRARGIVRPYHRGCSTITRCRR